MDEFLRGISTAEEISYYNWGNLEWLSIFNHEATHIWQNCTGRYRGGRGGVDHESEVARLYDTSHNWVYDQIERYGLETQQEGNRTMLRLVDLLQHRGEPQAGVPDNSVAHTEES